MEIPTTSRDFSQIFVVGDDFLRADNTIMQVGTGVSHQMERF